MPANIGFSVDFVGSGAAVLTVEVVGGPGPIFLETSAITVVFRVSNVFTRVVTFPAVHLAKEGAAKDKGNASLLSAPRTRTAGDTVENKLVVEPNEALTEADTLSVVVTAVEG